MLRDLRNDGEVAFSRFSVPKAKTLWYYRSLVREYRLGGVTHRLKPLIDDLDRVVTEVEHLVRNTGLSDSPATQEMTARAYCPDPAACPTIWYSCFLPLASITLIWVVFLISYCTTSPACSWGLVSFWRAME